MSQATKTTNGTSCAKTPGRTYTGSLGFLSVSTGKTTSRQNAGSLAKTPGDTPASPTSSDSSDCSTATSKKKCTHPMIYFSVNTSRQGVGSCIYCGSHLNLTAFILA